MPWCICEPFKYNMDLKSEGFWMLMELEVEIILYQCGNKGRPTMVHREWDKILYKKFCEMTFKKYEFREKGSNLSQQISGVM